MARMLLCAVPVALMLLPPAAEAAFRSYTISNRTAVAIVGATAVNNANPENAITFTLQGSIPSVANATVSFELPADDCLFHLTFTFANAKTIVQPDMDLCNLDGFVVE